MFKSAGNRLGLWQFYSCFCAKFFMYMINNLLKITRKHSLMGLRSTPTEDNISVNYAIIVPNQSLSPELC